MQTKKKTKPRHIRETRGKALVLAFIIIIAAIIAAFASSQVVRKNQDNFLKNQYPCTYSEYVEKYAELYDVPQSLVYAIIRTESGFQPDAGSSAGALGLMQLIPETFEWLQMRRESVGDYITDDLFQPEVNIDYGVYFLKYLLEEYESIETAIAAYNAGIGAVSDWLQNPEYSSDGVHLDYIPYSETREYVKRVTSAKAMYEDLYGF